jgi:integrase
MQRVVRSAAPETPYSEKELYPAVSRLALFAWASAGVPLEDDIVFNPKFINRFVQHHLEQYSRAGKNTMRARLRRTSEALLGDEAAGAFRALGKAEASRPYHLSEVASLLSWSSSQRNEDRATSAGTLLALGLGAGLTGREIIDLELGDITADRRGVEVHVSGDDARDVPVLARWEPFLVRRLTSGVVSRWAFRGGQRGGNVNLVTDFVSRNPRPSVELQARRMRATWIVEHLTRGTPLDLLLEVAGLQSAEALDRLLPYVTRTDDDPRREALR